MNAARISLFLGLCTAYAALAPCGAVARDSAVIRASGHINIGVEAGLPPLGEYDSQNVLVGYDLDIGRLIAAGLGVEPRFVTLSSSGRIPYLLAGKVDIVLGGLTQTAQRAQVIAFSRPLYAEQFAIIAPEGRGVSSFSDLLSGGHQLVEVRGSTAVAYLHEHAPHAPLLLLDSYADAIRALAQGRGDAMIDVIEYVGHYLPSQPQMRWTVIRGFAPTIGNDCVGLRREDVTLLADVNRLLESKEQDGHLAAIHDQWFELAPVQAVP